MSRGRRFWSPCRVCGSDHKNPASSGICETCGAKEREANVERARAFEDARIADEKAYAEVLFAQFMELSEEDRWRQLFNAVAALEAGS